MRYRELTETPIGNLEIHGMDQPGSFPDVDRKLLTNPQHVQNIRKRFENVPFDFHLYFVNRNVEYTKNYKWHEPDPNDPDKEIPVSYTAFTKQWNDDYDEYNGINNAETVKKLTGVVVQPDENGITVVFTSNANADGRIAMTPWMVGHRFGHALLDNVSRLPSNLKWNINKLLEFLGKVKTTDYIFHSARTGKLQGGEAFPELIAQYCNGGIRLDVKNNPELIHKQRAIGVLIDHIMDDCVGQIFIAV